MVRHLELFAQIAERKMVDRPYHNYEHALDVCEHALLYGKLEGVHDNDLLVLGIGGLLHDAVCIPGNSKNEEQTADFAEYMMHHFGYSKDIIVPVRKVILATRIDSEPETLLEQIIKDADTDNLGRKDFFEKNAKLQEELGQITNPDWYKHSYEFMQKHNYYTDSARGLRQKQKEQNMKALLKYFT